MQWLENRKPDVEVEAESKQSWVGELVELIQQLIFKKKEKMDSTLRNILEKT